MLDKSLVTCVSENNTLLAESLAQESLENTLSPVVLNHECAFLIHHNEEQFVRKVRITIQGIHTCLFKVRITVHGIHACLSCIRYSFKYSACLCFFVPAAESDRLSSVVNQIPRVEEARRIVSENSSQKRRVVELDQTPENEPCCTSAGWVPLQSRNDNSDNLLQQMSVSRDYSDVGDSSNTVMVPEERYFNSVFGLNAIKIDITAKRRCKGLYAGPSSRLFDNGPTSSANDFPARISHAQHLQSIHGVAIRSPATSTTINTCVVHAPGSIDGSLEYNEQDMSMDIAMPLEAMSLSNVPDG